MLRLTDITLGQYYPIDSPIHRLDPRTKLCGAMGAMGALMFIKDVRVYPFVFVWIIGIVMLASLPVALALKNLRTFVPLLLITFVANALFTPGHATGLFSVRGIGVTTEGLTQGALFTARLIAMLLIASVLTLTTAPIDVADGLEALLKPLTRFGVPAHELAMMTVIALRFIPTLVEEAERLQKAQTARGADFSGNPIRRAKKLLSLLIPLILSAFRRADDLAVAMEARCYRGGVGRTQMRELRLTRADGVAMGITGGLLVLCVWAGI